MDERKENVLRRLHRNDSVPALLSAEFWAALRRKGDLSVNICMDRPITAKVRIEPWAKLKTLLPHEYFSCAYNLPPEAFDASSFGDTVTAVLGRTPCLFMSH